MCNPAARYGRNISTRGKPATSPARPSSSSSASVARGRQGLGTVRTSAATLTARATMAITTRRPACISTRRLTTSIAATAPTPAASSGSAATGCSISSSSSARCAPIACWPSAGPRSPLEGLQRIGEPTADPTWPGYWFHRRVLFRGLRPFVQISYDRTARLSHRGRRSAPVHDRYATCACCRCPTAPFCPASGFR